MLLLCVIALLKVSRRQWHVQKFYLGWMGDCSLVRRGALEMILQSTLYQTEKMSKVKVKEVGREHPEIMGLTIPRSLSSSAIAKNNRIGGESLQ